MVDAADDTPADADLDDPVCLVEVCALADDLADQDGLGDPDDLAEDDEPEDDLADQDELDDLVLSLVEDDEPDDLVPTAMMVPGAMVLMAMTAQDESDDPALSPAEVCEQVDLVLALDAMVPKAKMVLDAKALMAMKVQGVTEVPDAMALDLASVEDDERDDLVPALDVMVPGAKALDPASAEVCEPDDHPRYPGVMVLGSVMNHRGNQGDPVGIALRCHRLRLSLQTLAAAMLRCMRRPQGSKCFQVSSWILPNGFGWFCLFLRACMSKLRANTFWEKWLHRARVLHFRPKEGDTRMQQDNKPNNQDLQSMGRPDPRGKNGPNSPETRADIHPSDPATAQRGKQPLQHPDEARRDR